MTLTPREIDAHLLEIGGLAHGEQRTMFFGKICELIFMRGLGSRFLVACNTHEILIHRNISDCRDLIGMHLKNVEDGECSSCGVVR